MLSKAKLEFGTFTLVEVGKPTNLDKMFELKNVYKFNPQLMPVENCTLTSSDRNGMSVLLTTPSLIPQERKRQKETCLCCLMNIASSISSALKDNVLPAV